MATAAPGAPGPREVPVEISVDHKTGKIKVNPDPFWVSIAANEEVVWHCTSTDPDDPEPVFTVDFNSQDGSPFYETHFYTKRSNSVYSGLVKRGVKPGPKGYKYTITVGNLPPADPDGGVKP